MTLSMLQVEAEVRYQSRRLNQYTCMAVWGGNNELEPALGWFPESKENPIRYAVDFAELFINSIRAMLTSPGEDKPGKIPFVDSSPSNGIVSEEPYVKRYAAILPCAHHRPGTVPGCRDEIACHNPVSTACQSHHLCTLSCLLTLSCIAISSRLCMLRA